MLASLLLAEWYMMISYNMEDRRYRERERERERERVTFVHEPKYTLIFTNCISDVLFDREIY